MSRFFSSLAVLGLVALTSCGPSIAHPSETRTMPDERALRTDAIDALGSRLHAAMLGGTVLVELASDDVLRALLDPESATRLSARRATTSGRLGNLDRVTTLFAGTRYLGACLQDSHDEPGSTHAGLRASGWIVRRVLVAATLPTGRRVATWVDGVLVYTDVGFALLDVERIEDPRWEHSDLDIAPCDMATRLR